MQDDNNVHHFNCLAESAKVEFQKNVEGLLELYSEFSTRLSTAQENNKEGVFFRNGEIEVFKDWLMQTSSSLLENYALIDHTNRITNKLYKSSLKIQEHELKKKSIQLKDLVA